MYSSPYERGLGGDWTDWLTNPFAAAFNAGASASNPNAASAQNDARLTAALQKMKEINAQLAVAKGHADVPEVNRLLPQLTAAVNEYKYWSRIAGQYDFTYADQMLASYSQWVKDSLSIAGNVTGDIAKKTFPYLLAAVAVYALASKVKL
jgi:hypothetical protein